MYRACVCVPEACSWVLNNTIVLCSMMTRTKCRYFLHGCKRARSERAPRVAHTHTSQSLIELSIHIHSNMHAENTHINASFILTSIFVLLIFSNFPFQHEKNMQQIINVKNLYQEGGKALNIC